MSTIESVEKFLIDTAIGISEVEADVQIFAPQEGAQTDFLSRSEYEVLFGGSAGGGKSYMLILDALGLQFEHDEFGMPAYKHPKYKAIIFRRETSQLAQLIDYGKAMYLPLGAQFVLSRKGEVGSTFDFSPIGGGKIYLAHMEQESDKENHQGIEYQYIGFDELSHFTYNQYIYLFSRARGLVSNNGVILPIRIRATSNPIGEHVGWVRERFIGSFSNQRQPRATYFFVGDDSYCGKEVTPKDNDFKFAKSRTFIPALLKDNKLLMEGNPQYMLSIMQMGAQYERALLQGDWFAFSGSFFSDFNQSMIIEPYDIPIQYPLYASIDAGWSSPCAILLAALTPKREIHILFTQYKKGASPQEHAKEFKDRLNNFPYLYNHQRKIQTIVAGLDAFAEKEKYAINMTEETFAHQFNKLGFALLPAKTERVAGWWAVKQLLRQGRLKFFADYNTPLITELMEAVADENDPEDIKGRGNDASVIDHAIDSLRYLIYSIPELNVPEQVLATFKKVRYGKKVKFDAQSQETIMSI
mgnify:FL=1